MAYMGQMDPDTLAQMPESTRTMVEMRPAWATGAFAIAVWGGALGCLLLLLRKAVALYIFAASALGIQRTNLYRKLRQLSVTRGAKVRQVRTS